MAIDVSSAYRAMMTGRQVSSRIQVRILSGDSVFFLDDHDIVKESWSVNWRSSNNRAFSLGTCYATSLSFSAFVSVEPEIDGQSVIIEPTMYYKVGNGEVAFPLGQFTCDKPKVYTKTTAYDCYDRMLAFDKRVESRFSGTPFNAIEYICQKCGVVNGMTQQQIANMINSSQLLVIDPLQVNTYRDALAYISIILGGYCIMDRSGKFSLRHFHTTPDMELPKHRRITTTFGGYKTCFCGVKCRFLAEQNYYPYSDIDEEAEGLILDLGDIPIIEDTENAKKRILSNIHDLLSHIEYYPCEIEMVGDPSIEAGDMITTKDRNGVDRNIILTSVTYAWRASANILSEGSDPKMENVSTVEKRRQASQDAAAKAAAIVTGTYVNVNPITIDGTGTQTVTDLKFVTNKDLTAIFGASIPLVSDGDGILEITYDDSGILGDVVRVMIHEGDDLVTLVNHLFYYANSVVNLHLRAKTYGINGGSAPTVTIGMDKIRSYIFAQGIETEAAWDGIIVIDEDVNVVETYMDMLGIEDGGTSVNLYEPIDEPFTELLSALGTEVQAEQLNDTMDLSLKLGDHVLRMGMGNRMGMGRVLGGRT